MKMLSQLVNPISKTFVGLGNSGKGVYFFAGNSFLIK